MSTPVALSPMKRWGSIVVVWIAAVVCTITIALVATPQNYAPWLSLSLAICIVGSLCVQLATQEKRGFVDRLIGSIVGSIVVLAIASLILALTSLAR
jgi:hypothetical protein